MSMAKEIDEGKKKDEKAEKKSDQPQQQAQQELTAESIVEGSKKIAQLNRTKELSHAKSQQQKKKINEKYDKLLKDLDAEIPKLKVGQEMEDYIKTMTK